MIYWFQIDFKSMVNWFQILIHSKKSDHEIIDMVQIFIRYKLYGIIDAFKRGKVIKFTSNS